MNIFVFDEDPVLCAQYHPDKLLVKMVLETAQLLCTVQHLRGEASPPYKKTHSAHPAVLWTCESIANYRWLVELGLALAVEYTYRYGRRHKSQDVIEWCRDHEPDLPSGPRTPFALMMPDQYKTDSAEESYRRYFREDKAHLASWTSREDPHWF